MAWLYRTDTGEPVQVPDAQVLDALRTGKVGFAKDQPVIMRNDGGETYEVKPGDVWEMYDRGYRLESVDEQRGRELQEKYGDTGGQIAAALAGAGRGLTFGASDWVLVNSGLVDPATLRHLQDVNPGISTAAELGTIGASLLIPGAGAAGAAARGGRLAEGARLSTAAPRAVAGLATKIERGTAAALRAKGAGQGLAKAAGMTAAGAVEGAVYGGGHFVSEVSLGRVEPTAEALVAHVGAGSIFGGLAGGGFAVTGAGGRALINRTKQTAKGIVSLWERKTGQKALPGLVEEVEEQVVRAGAPEKISGVLTGKRPENISKFVRGAERRAKRAAATSGPEARDNFARRMAREHDEMLAAKERVIDAGTGKQKKRFFEEMAQDGDLGLAGAQAERLVGLGDDAGELIARLEKMKAAGRGHYDFQAGKFSIDDVLRKAKAAREEIQTVIQSGKGKAIGKIHGHLDDLKRTVGKAREKMARSRSTDGASLATMDAFEDLYKLLREPLENASIWGKSAARFQREVNESWVQHLEAVKRRPDHRFLESFESADWTRKSQARPDGYRKYIDDLGSTKNDIDEPWLLHQLETENEVMRRIARQYDDRPELLEALDRHTEALGRFKKLHDEAKSVVGLQNQLDDLTKGGGGGMLGGLALGGAGTLALTGDPTSAAGLGVAALAFSALTRPGRVIHSLATLDRMVAGFRGSVSRKVGNYIQNVKRAAAKTGEKARRLVAPAAARESASIGLLERSNWGDKATMDRNRREAHKRRLSELAEVVSNPQLAADRLAANTAPVQAVAPQIAAHMQRIGARAVAFLHDKAPKDPRTTMLRGEWVPSDAELSRWERYAAATLHPESVLDDLVAGRISHEGVEALRVVYPHLYEDLRAELSSRVAELRESVPYKERIQLSILFDVPVDETMTPRFLASMAVAGRDVPMPESHAPGGGWSRRGRGPGTRKGDFRRMDNPQRATTHAQRMALGGTEA